MTELFHPEKIIFADLDETEAVVLNLETKNYYKLNETGRWIWKEITNGLSESDVAKKLSTTFDVSPDEALADVKSFVENLRFEMILAAEKPSFSIDQAHQAKMGKQPLTR